jgi:hypothetical protein
MLSKNSRIIWQTVRNGLIGILLPFGCDDSSGRDGSAGAYHATSFVTTKSGQSTNHIPNGSTIHLVLTPAGTTTGQIHMAASGANAPLDADLTGTWVASGSAVNLDGTADTFLRDMTLTYNDDTLVGDQTFAGTRIQLTLTRD